MSIIAILLIFSMLAVMWSDVTRYLIPNWLVALLLLAYPAAVYMSPVIIDWKMAIVAMLAVLAAGYVIFAMKWMGAGDIKLLAACALWVGWENLPDFLMRVALIGGLFAILLYVGRKAIPLLPLNVKLPRILREGEPVPYGVAIALGFLIMLSGAKIAAAGLAS